MSRDSQTKERKKRFTNRETILLVSLALVALIYAYANFFFLPTLDKINLVRSEKETLQLEYDTRNSLIAQKDGLQDQLEENNRLYSEYKTQYYKTTNQEHLIKVLELDLFEKNDLDIASLQFNEVLPIDEFNSGEERIISLQSRVVTFPFEGSYDGLIELIRRLENNKELIRINSLDIIQVEPSVAATNNQVAPSVVATNNQVGNKKEVLYQGNITIEFFIIPQEYEYPWNVGLPEYDKAPAYEGSLFSFDDGGVVPPVKEVPDEVEVDNGSVDEIDEEKDKAQIDDEVDNGSVDEIDDDKTRPSTYVVQPGDTLWGISTRFYGTNDHVDQIMFLNKITDTRLFRSGSTIKLPLSLK